MTRKEFKTLLKRNNKKQKIEKLINECNEEELHLSIDLIESRLEHLKATTLKDIPKYCYKVKLNDFLLLVTKGAFDDTQGEGFYAYNDKMSELPYKFIDAKEIAFKYKFTHIVWFGL